MERMWQQCLFKYLRCEPEEHHVMLTEPPLNTPENRLGQRSAVDTGVVSARLLERIRPSRAMLSLLSPRVLEDHLLADVVKSESEAWERVPVGCCRVWGHPILSAHASPSVSLKHMWLCMSSRTRVHIQCWNDRVKSV